MYDIFIKSGFIWVLVIAVVIKLCAEYFKPAKGGRSAESKGAAGEHNFFFVLLGNLFPWRYRIIRDTLGLPSDIVFSVVAFSDKALFKTDMPQGVFYFSEVPRFIKSHERRLIKREQVPEIIKVIKEWQKSIPRAVKKKHVENLKASCRRRN